MEWIFPIFSAIFGVIFFVVNYSLRHSTISIFAKEKEISLYDFMDKKTNFFRYFLKLMFLKEKYAIRSISFIAPLLFLIVLIKWNINIKEILLIKYSSIFVEVYNSIKMNYQNESNIIFSLFSILIFNFHVSSSIKFILFFFFFPDFITILFKKEKRVLYVNRVKITFVFLLLWWVWNHFFYLYFLYGFKPIDKIFFAIFLILSLMFLLLKMISWINRIKINKRYRIVDFKIYFQNYEFNSFWQNDKDWLDYKKSIEIIKHNKKYFKERICYDRYMKKMNICLIDLGTMNKILSFVFSLVPILFILGSFLD